MMKKMKRVPMESSPSYAVDEEVKNRYKIQSLMQDFDELEKETEETKRILQKGKQRKFTLSAEVKFLRRRCKYLMNNPHQTTSAEQVVQPPKTEVVREVTARERKNKKKEVTKQNPIALLDLNQISDPRGDETGECQVAWEPLRMDKKLKRCTIEGRNALTHDTNLSIHKDVKNGSNRKRKIAWQDQVGFEGLRVITSRK